VNNDPANFMDPDGRFAAAAAAGGAAAAAGAALSLWAAWDCAVNNCQGVRALMDDLLGKPYCPTRDKEKEKPKKDCAEICEPYMGPNGSFVGNDGHTYTNDAYGNFQPAFQRCFDECEGRL
jgi:hypothetical protein